MDRICLTQARHFHAQTIHKVACCYLCVISQCSASQGLCSTDIGRWAGVSYSTVQNLVTTGFGRWCITFRNIEFSDFIHRPGIKKQRETRRFGNWICFRPQVREKTYSVGSLRKS
jgi:hypothetical protein